MSWRLPSSSDREFSPDCARRRGADGTIAHRPEFPTGRSLESHHPECRSERPRQIRSAHAKRCERKARWNLTDGSGIPYPPIIGVPSAKCRSERRRQKRPFHEKRCRAGGSNREAARPSLRVSRQAHDPPRAARQGLALSPCLRARHPQCIDREASGASRGAAGLRGGALRRRSGRASCKRSGATPPAGCNTATIRIGKRCASNAKPVVLRILRRACRASAAASASISTAPSRRGSWRWRR